MLVLSASSFAFAQAMPDITVYDPRSPMGMGLNPAEIAGYQKWTVDLHIQEKGMMWFTPGINVIGGVSAAVRVFGPLYIGAQGLLGGHGNDLSGGGRIGLSVRFWKGSSLGISGEFFKIEDDGTEYHKAINLGLLLRPSRYVSLGTSFIWDWDYNGECPCIPCIFRAGLGVMPMGNDRFTMGADFQVGRQIKSRVGLSWTARLARGVNLGLRINMLPGDKFHFGGTLGIRVALGIPELFAGGGWSAANQSETLTLGASFGPKRPPSQVVGPKRWVVYDIRGLNLSCSGPFSVDCSLLQTLKDLDTLSRTEGIKGVLLRIGDCPRGMGTADLIAGSIKRLQKKGLKVVVATGMCGPDGFAAFSNADRIYMVPGTASAIIPEGHRLIFLGDLFQTLGVQTQYVATGRYKTFPLMFTRNSPAKTQLDMWGPMLKQQCMAYVDRINRIRDTKLNCVPGSPALYSAKAALKKGLADGLMHMDAVVTDLSVKQDARFVRWPLPNTDRTGLANLPKIAIIPVVGDIVPGRSIDLPFGDIHLAGAASIAQLIDRAAWDSDTAGILLFVDSPGGDLASSELIHHSIEMAKKNKPVAVLFGNVAASGGYYISTAASRIFAPTSVVTGSIGVFLLRFSVLDLLSKLGISTFPVPKGRDVGLFSLLASPKKQDKQGMKGLLNDAFDLFISRVRVGRGQRAADWAKSAGAMVVNGRQALKIGLVDQVAGMDDALDYLKKQAGISAFGVSIMRPPTLIERLASSFKLFGMAVFKTIGSAVQAVLAQSVSGVVSVRLPYVYGR